MMRTRITFDSATTAQVRALSVALNKVLGDNNLTLGVEGPECWHGETPLLTPEQLGEVVRLTSTTPRPPRPSDVVSVEPLDEGGGYQVRLWSIDGTAQVLFSHHDLPIAQEVADTTIEQLESWGWFK